MFHVDIDLWVLVDKIKVYFVYIAKFVVMICYNYTMKSYLNFVMQLKNGKELLENIRKQSNKEFHYMCHSQKQNILRRFPTEL
jgi:hypothetical protein